jgi:hypothetical protein
VKNALKYSGQILLTAVYCLAISFVARPISVTHSYTSTSTEQASYISGISASLFSHTTQSESSAQNLNNLPAPVFKNLFSELWVIVNAAGKLLKSEFLQYTSFSKNFRTFFSNVDIIFPFHNFW